MTAGKWRPRVVVTRARMQSSGLAQRLEALGAEPVILPLIAIEPPASWTVLDAALGQIRSFDWIIFTSSNGVDAAVRRMSELGLDPKACAGARVATIGTATTEAAVRHGLGTSLQAPVAVAESLAATLQRYARADGRPGRFLLIRAEEARDVLPDQLQAAGADVTIAPAYRNAVPAEAVATVRQVFHSDRLPDAITFTSSSTVRHLFALLASVGLALPRAVVRASIGPVTSATLREFGDYADVEAATATTDALAEAVIATLVARRACERAHRGAD